MLTESQIRATEKARRGAKSGASRQAVAGHLIKTNKIGYRKLANGKIVKSVDEQYLRDDLPCGLRNCPLCHTNISKFTTKTRQFILSVLDCKLNIKFKG